MVQHKISDRLHELNVLSLQFAKFEDDLNPIDYTQLSGVERVEYKIYCIVWFNFMSTIFDDNGKDVLDTVVYTPEIINQHKSWWLNDPVNKEAYSDGFKAYVEKIINR